MTEETKEQISMRADLQSLRDRGWTDEQLAEYAGKTVAQVRKMLKDEEETPSDG